MFLLDKKTIKKKGSISRAFGYSKTIPFNPLTLPSYQAGYLMNRQADIPPGSISPNAINAQWYDAIVLSVASKYLQSPAAYVLQVLNGFNCYTLNATNIRLQNPPFDVFDGTFTDFSFLIGFKLNSAIGATGRFIFCQNNAAEDERLFLILSATTGLAWMRLSNAAGANPISVLTVNNYGDQLMHAFIGVVNQSTKTIRLITHTGENLSTTNLAYVSKSLQVNSASDFQIGDTNPTFGTGQSGQPAAIGDVIVLKTVLDDAGINDLMAWECSRLGIAHVPI